MVLSYSGKPQALICDLGGTVIDHGSHGPVMPFIEVFKRHGVTVTAEETRAFMGVSKRQHFDEIGNLDSVGQRWRDVHGAPFDGSSAEADAMFEEFMDLQRAAVRASCEPIAGVPDVIAACRARGLKFGCTTGYPSELANICVAEMKTRGLEMDAIVSSSDVPKGRPEPYQCLQSMIALEVWPAAACINVDDSVFGVTGGVNAGMWSIGIAVTGNEFGMTVAEVQALAPDDFAERRVAAYKRLEAAGAHFVIDSIADILPCLETIEARLADGAGP